MRSVRLISIFFVLLLIFFITFFVIFGYFLLIRLFFLFIFLQGILVVSLLFCSLVIRCHGFCMLSQLVFSQELNHVHVVVICDFWFVIKLWFVIFLLLSLLDLTD